VKWAALAVSEGGPFLCAAQMAERQIHPYYIHFAEAVQRTLA